MARIYLFICPRDPSACQVVSHTCTHCDCVRKPRDVNKNDVKFSLLIATHYLWQRPKECLNLYGIHIE